jgi:hypothetical protein
MNARDNFTKNGKLTVAFDRIERPCQCAQALWTQPPQALDRARHSGGKARRRRRIASVRSPARVPR